MMQPVMKKINLLAIVVLLITGCQNIAIDTFPDGTVVDKWFHDYEKLDVKELGTHFTLTDYGVKTDSNIVQTVAIQQVIDLAASNGGGVIVVPKGVFLSGALFFKPNTHLHLQEGGAIKGSDDIANYPLIPSRMEGQCLDYYAALINVYGVDGFTITGSGKINGNGLNYWKAFWQRRAENPKCTNLEVSRPRLVFIRDSKDVQLQDASLVNSGFWTCHLYKCSNVKLLDLHIFAPREPVKAPSSDAVDIDVCNNVLIKGCYMSVNDDAIAIKGGKGPWADKDSCNGENTNIIVEDCEFGFCHSALTCGSESIHNRNIIMRRCNFKDAKRGLWLKMRPDTPQLYEYIQLESITGEVSSLLYVKPWRQFFDLKGRTDVPVSHSDYITFKNIAVNCNIFFDVAITEHDSLSNFTFEELNVNAKKSNFNPELVNNIQLKNVTVNGKLWSN